MTRVEQCDSVESRPDFVAFVRALRQDLKRNPEGWENNTLDLFLEALGAWAEDMDGYYLNQGKPVPTLPDCKLLASMLMGATMYE